MTRDQALNQAVDSIRSAEVLARHAESAAHSDDHRHKAAAFAAAGALRADIARTYAALAQTLPADGE